MDPSTSSTPDEERTRRRTWYLEKAGFKEPAKVPILTKPVPRHFQSDHVDCNNEALRILSECASQLDLSAPEKHKLHFFRTKKQKEATNRQSKPTFSNYDVAIAFDSLLASPQWPPTGVAQSLLAYATTTSIDQLWAVMQTRDLIQTSSSRGRMPWLGMAVSREDWEYVQLMCQSRVGPSSLGWAFGAALARSSIPGMNLLLSHGAGVSQRRDLIERHFAERHMGIVEILLSAPNCMETQEWLRCLGHGSLGASSQLSAQISDEILLLCVANRTDLVCGSIILENIRLQNHQATAVLLAYAEPSLLSEIQTEACDLVCRMTHIGRKTTFFELLAKSSLIEDGTGTRQTLFESLQLRRLSPTQFLAETGLVEEEPGARQALFEGLQARHLRLAGLLIQEGVTVDFPPYDALEDALSRRDFPVLELLKGASTSRALSDTIALIPEDASEGDTIRLLDIFSPFEESCCSVDKLLVRSVERKQLRLLRTLLSYGASAEFTDAFAVQLALRNEDFDALALLLRHKWSPAVLSHAVPVAMALRPASKRFSAMKALLAKGVQPPALITPLEDLVAEVQGRDDALTRLLLGNGAPIDRSNDTDRSPVIVAVRRGDESLLRTLLCKAKPRPPRILLATAVYNALLAIDILDYDIILNMLTLLLQRGASGFPIHLALASAAMRDSRLDVARLLLQYKADANASGGIAFVNAVESGCYSMLELLCDKSPPNTDSFRHALQTIIDPLHYSPDMLSLLLQKTNSTVKLQGLSGSVGIETHLPDHPHALDVIRCLVREGLDVNKCDGLPLIIAVRSENLGFTRELLEGSPTVASLAVAFTQAAGIKLSMVKPEMWEMLLKKSCSAEIGQSACLLGETNSAIDGDLTGLRCLVRHRPNVNLNNGEAVYQAAITGSLEVLKLLLPIASERSVLDRAFLATSSSSLSLDQKRRVCHELVAAEVGVSTKAISDALYQSITVQSPDMLLVLLLLSLGAQVKFPHLQAAQGSSQENLFQILIDKVARPTGVFALYRMALIDVDQKYRAYSCLVEKGVSKEELSRALFQFIESHPGRLDIPKLLLENGAPVTFKNGFAMADVVETGNLETVRLLSAYLASAPEGLADPAFDRVARSRNTDPIARLDIYRCLLKSNVGKSRLYRALEDTIEDESPSNATVRLLLEHGTDPNQNGARSFVLAMQKDHELQFRALSKYADLEVVLPKLLQSCVNDEDAVRWFQLCLREQPTDLRLSQDGLLVSCLEKFRKGSALLEVLLDRGLSASVMTTVRFLPGWDVEECTMVIWALSLSGEVAHKAIIALIEAGDSGKSNSPVSNLLDRTKPKIAMATYSTPYTHVSAAFLCLLGKSRLPVLQALIDAGGQDVLNSTVPGSTLRDLASKKECTSTEDFMPLFEDDDEISLREAALFLGNLPAFRLLHVDVPEDDGTLHFAALLALPDFVQWLLESHDPNHESEAFDMMVPLALACFSKPFPWCRVAIEDSPWEKRLQKTMHLLLFETDKDWQHRKRSPLFIALENGLEVTSAMLKAMDATVPKARAAEIYKDKQGKEYSPSQYIAEFVDGSEKEQRLLKECLNMHGRR